MPRCVRCMKDFHPDWCIETVIRGDNVVVCCFCKVEKNILTVTDDDGNIVENVTKDQANRNYLKYLDDLSQKPAIAEILVKAKKQG